MKKAKIEVEEMDAGSGRFVEAHCRGHWARRAGTAVEAERACYEALRREYSGHEIERAQAEARRLDQGGAR